MVQPETTVPETETPDQLVLADEAQVQDFLDRVGRLYDPATRARCASQIQILRQEGRASVDMSELAWNAYNEVHASAIVAANRARLSMLVSPVHIKDRVE